MASSPLTLNTQLTNVRSHKNSAHVCHSFTRPEQLPKDHPATKKNGITHVHACANGACPYLLVSQPIASGHRGKVVHDGTGDFVASPELPCQFGFPHGQGEDIIGDVTRPEGESKKEKDKPPCGKYLFQSTGPYTHDMGNSEFEGWRNDGNVIQGLASQRRKWKAWADTVLKATPFPELPRTPQRVVEAAHDNEWLKECMTGAPWQKLCEATRLWIISMLMMKESGKKSPPGRRSMSMRPAATDSPKITMRLDSYDEDGEASKADMAMAPAAMVPMTAAIKKQEQDKREGSDIGNEMDGDTSGSTSSPSEGLDSDASDTSSTPQQPMKKQNVGKGVKGAVPKPVTKAKTGKAKEAKTENAKGKQGRKPKKSKRGRGYA